MTGYDMGETAALVVAKLRGWSFQWAVDQFAGPPPEGCPDCKRVEFCWLVDENGDVLQSLSEIWEADEDYKRDVEGQLAMEAMGK